LLVLFVLRFRPSPICFITTVIVAALDPTDKTGQHGLFRPSLATARDIPRRMLLLLMGV